MAGIKSNTLIEFKDMEITINTLLQKQTTFPIIVKTSKNRGSHGFLGNHGMPEETEMLLHRTMRVKYAHINVYTSSDGARDKQSSEDIGDNHYLLPVKYHGKFKFIHRPGRRKRYASVSEVMNDLPRFITIWENTQAVDCSDLDTYVTVEAGTTLEIVRKFTRPDNKHTLLECTSGETSIAFSEHERLNCTAIDDCRQYNLFELVRSKLLPRFIKFDDADLNDIVHVDDALHYETTTAVENPMELLGFTDIEVLVGCIRNETNETYETVLIPRDLWTSLFVHEEYPSSKENTEAHVERLYQPVGEIYFIEKSLYLLPIHQRQVVSLVGPNFIFKRDSSCSNNVDNETEGENELMYQGPVVLLPQVKKKKTLFKKVHKEILRIFKSNNDEKTSNILLKNQQSSERREPKRYTRNVQPSISRSTTSLELRHDPVHLRYIRKRYGDASYLEFSHDNADGRSEMEMSPMQLRLSVSLGDLSNATFLHLGSSSNIADDTMPSLFSMPEQGDGCKEIIDSRPKELCAYSSPMYYRQRHTPVHATASVPVVSRTQISVSWGDMSRCGTQGKLQNKDSFYSYNVEETYQCFKNCGLDDFAVQCKKNKLDGSFFRNFDCSLLKDEPFYLSTFSVLKITKIIHEGWRPT